MVAVMVERRHETEPTGPGHGMLLRWAYWMRGGLPGSAGEWAVRQRIGPSRDIEPPEEAARVDRIVAQLGLEYPQYRRMLRRFYLNDEAYWEIAAELRYTVGFVKLSIQGACDLVAKRFEEQSS